MTNNHFMEEAIQIAYENVLKNNGGPFGAIVVKDGVIIGTARFIQAVNLVQCV